MTMPQQRLRAFLSAGVVLRDVAMASEHKEKWGTEFPERLVREAKRALRYYPSSLEIERAADEQRSMHTWMATEVRTTLQADGVFGRLREAAAHIGAETAPNDLAFDCDAYLNEWLWTEHPALGYREPADFLDVSSNLEMFIELFKAEAIASCEARRVFESEAMAYRWLRKFERSLEGIPLEMLGSDAGRRKVMDELRRLAVRYKSAKRCRTTSATAAQDAGRTT